LIIGVLGGMLATAVFNRGLDGGQAVSVTWSSSWPSNRLRPRLPIDDDLVTLPIGATLPKTDVEVLDSQRRSVAERCLDDDFLVRLAMGKEPHKLSDSQRHEVILHRHSSLVT